MIAALPDELTLNDDQLRVVSLHAGVNDLPSVLASRLKHRSVSRRDAAFDQAVRELLSRNVLAGGVVHPDLVPVLRALQRPDRELAVRLVTPEGIVRLSVVRRGTLCVLACRIADSVMLRKLGHSLELRDVAKAVATRLPRAQAADVLPVGAPLVEMAETLSGTQNPTDLADRIRALGTESRAALLLGAALASRHAFVEVVYYTLADDDDLITRGPAAVALFYTKRGRIVAAPSASPAGQLWTTFKAGSDHAFGQAIGQLVELASVGWTAVDGNAFCSA